MSTFSRTWSVLVSAVDAPCGVVDASLRWTFVDERMLQLLGADRAELLGRDLRDCVDPKAREPMLERVSRVVSGDAPRAEMRAPLDRDGENARGLAWTFTSLAESGDAHARVFVVLRDDAENRRRLEQLRVTERALHAAASGVVICDAEADDLPIVYVNAAFERITGYGAADVLGRNCRMLNDPERDQPGLAEVRAAIDARRETTVVLRNHRKDGGAFWNELTISPVFDPDGTVTHFIGIQHDITERMQFTAERERLLAESVAARQAAARAAKVRETLLAIVSHELRSPLNAIRLWASLLQTEERVDADLLRRAVGRIEDAVEVQRRIIDDLLDLSRFESGRIVLQRRAVDLAVLASEVVARNRPLFEQRGIVLEFVAGQQSTSALVDRDRVVQVLQNLLDNAMKFTPRGGVVACEVMRHDTSVRVLVRDSGEGIAADQLTRVFEQFWQAGAGDTRRHGGLGLGLGIVKHIVDRHGGTVRAHSEGRGKGATFVVELPAHDPRRRGARAAPAGNVPSAVVEGDVLVVDDDRATVEALVLGLRLHGFAARPASDAEQARAAVATQRPRLLVSDLMMPGTSGLEFVERLRRDEFDRGLPRLPAVAISGRGDAAEGRSARLAGFDRFLAKPVRVQDLVACLEELAAAPPPPKSARIVVAIGDRDLGERMRERLARRGHEVQVAAAAAEALALVDACVPDVIVAGALLPDGPGAALLEGVLRDEPAVLTILLDADPAASGLAVDVILRPDVDSDDLAAIVSRWQGIAGGSSAATG